MADGKNSIVDLKKYLSTEEHPVSSQEMTEFWNGLTDEEKVELKEAELE